MTTNDDIALKTNDFYKSIFDKCDRDKDGYITLNELNVLIETREYAEDIPDHIIKRIHEKHDHNKDKKLDYEEFISMINNPALQDVFGHYIARYINWIIPRKSIPPSHTATDGLYEEEYSCYPPAVGMIIFSLLQIIFFCIDEAREANSTNSASGIIATLFLYCPSRRREVWRYFTYMFVHVGVFHLVVNLLVQILLGIPLEMVHHWWRVLIVYLSGVLAGSLGTSVVDPSVKLAGASGGVYALVTAHIASIILNWKEMSYPVVQLLIFIIVAGADIGTAIYNRYVLEINEHIGYAAHFAGALAGLLVGINILRNLSITKTERVIWWISIISFSILLTFCIIWNAVYKNYFPEEIY